MPDIPRLTRLHIEGFRPFRDFTAELGALEVIVGANAGGKSALFDFLRFLRDGMEREIPPGIMAEGVALYVFHVPGPERIAWELEAHGVGGDYCYRGEVAGPIGRLAVQNEEVWRDGGVVAIPTPARNRLALSKAAMLNDPLTALREYIADWRLYSTFRVDTAAMRRVVPTEQAAVLREDAGNISAVLLYLFTQHQDVFQALERNLGRVVPGFLRLSVGPYGGPGFVMAFWHEQGVPTPLPLADLSDGVLRLLAWMVLCVHPNPPTLIAIDEPDVGIHPRALSLLAAMLQRLAERTQVLITTHDSRFLAEFGLDAIAVMRKEDGQAVLRRASDSPVLRALLDDFGQTEIETLHRSNELESFT
jgi:predicted ATPase